MIHFLKNVAVMGGLLILAYASPDKTVTKASRANWGTK
jgi:uncharacterized membrane protein